ncbi:anaerobic ribonucleoside-triphosphate reductase activating protein [Candidatus Atribacteria bacterium RBG_19FT_COMBO_35_14]|uniref:Anaerobic ribonucleoside-triphosphate reductase activating protein n=1 Tax=Candidatus Sediminicultor quintus TaxID=1797291 RepID=A0A1F5A726_9BACT|nr:MAG: anaerobic ribonucleoside-triphosphate reductase activating protein [Candidatus Atribacteria bacterium RBG_19FT_COMBO_35_14]
MIGTSLIDWEGKIVSTLYVPSCNFRCPFCYNCDLILRPDNFKNIPQKEIDSYLLERKDFIDGICMSGGEPTLYPDLPSYFKEIKNKGFLIKLDTNGTNPKLLEDLLKFRLIDYIAMDIKSSLDFDCYSKAAGIKDKILLERVKDSITLIMNSETDYEFRTTVVPVLHTEENIIEIAKYISGAKKYVLQNFSPLEKTLDPSFQKIKPYSDEKIQELSEKAKKYVPNCCWR